jgi:hypothetical protein
MYLVVLNDKMVGFANITARAILDHLFMAYGNITAVYLENNFEQMRRAWDHQQPVESLSKHIQDCADYSEATRIRNKSMLVMQRSLQLGTSWVHAAGGMKTPTWKKHEHNSKLTSPLHTPSISKCRVSLHHAANAAVGKTEEKMGEATIGDLANLATATAADRGVVATLAEANAHLAKQLEDNTNELRELKALLKNERTERRGQRSFKPLPNT